MTTELIVLYPEGDMVFTNQFSIFELKRLATKIKTKVIVTGPQDDKLFSLVTKIPVEELCLEDLQ